MDYKTQIEEIQATGLTQAAIGAAIGKSQVWVSDFLRGRYKDIKSAEAKSIGELHSSVFAHLRTTPAAKEAA